MKNDARKGVHHGGERGDGENVARNFDGALFGRALDLLQALRMRHRADVPYIVQDFSRIADQERGKLAIIIPGADNGLFVDFFALLIEEKRNWRDIRLSAVEADVALALLLGIVERMRVQEGPDELPADVFEAEFEVRVLVDSVMPAVKRGGADVEALFVGDLFRRDEARRVTSARGGDCGIKRMREGVAESDARPGGINMLAGMRAVEHARLGSHVG